MFKVYTITTVNYLRRKVVIYKFGAAEMELIGSKSFFPEVEGFAVCLAVGV